MAVATGFPPKTLLDKDEEPRLTVELLRQIQSDQQRITRLLSDRFEPNRHVPELAKEIWQSKHNAWDGSNQEYWARESPDANLGLEFLKTLCPGGQVASTVGASDIDISEHIQGIERREEQGRWLQKFSGGTRRRWGAVPTLQVALAKFNRWLSSHRGAIAMVAGARGGGADDVWPDAWFADPLADEAGNVATTATVVPHTLEDPFTYYHAVGGMARPGEVQSKIPICGVLESPGHLSYGMVMFHIRSFVVVGPDDGVLPPPEKWFRGVRCVRERTAFQGFYDDQTLHLAERRYSTALSMLPLQQPSGHFSLVSIIDVSVAEDPDLVWGMAPGYERVYDRRSAPWERYGLHPAGLYSGVSALQLQVCSFLESWGRDWNRTIDAIDSKVSVQLRRLVLKTKSDASVLYFKVLQLLGIFSDAVSEVEGALEALERACRNPEVFLGNAFHKTYPHTTATMRVLDQNWSVAKALHKDLAGRVQERLDRSKHEVLGLRDGLFNVQSVVEAQKSFELNKYLFVFTVVTIVYLPPTFVASFFGMEIFNADTVPETQTFFWTLIKWFCAVTYVLAIAALIGTRLLPSSDRLKAWNPIRWGVPSPANPTRAGVTMGSKAAWTNRGDANILFALVRHAAMVVSSWALAVLRALDRAVHRMAFLFSAQGTQKTGEKNAAAMPAASAA
ncbi:cora-like Mg2+ transporter protein-domain-containing protein [Microdochium trichocladiopsis]|uniref:Cora-like Mg2+ transporter protein-domain-containing protein n=1 Tax=Microdochium trichocladiopsis TaxID=1682393 RepID=A0A9P9BP08_9PEZI|nr:cora-like Mg2+ transporter protein-domain-containing protein [Microdochium trichocladiopsis]KAH7028767.1 cora-like Mg2+ transporter protein-domain-containing protein [Microdochium trichocladiopsis]